MDFVDINYKKNNGKNLTLLFPLTPGGGVATVEIAEGQGTGDKAGQ